MEREGEGGRERESTLLHKDYKDLSISRHFYKSERERGTW